MKIAYLILCHKNDNQVLNLVDCLSTDQTFFYIHLDKKSQDFISFERDNVFWIPEKERIDVKWGTYKMVEAELALIDLFMQRSDSASFDYICLLSGQDFPLKNNTYISDFLTKHRGDNFISVINHNHPRYQRFYKRNALYYPKLIQNSSKHFKFLKKLYILISGGYSRTFRLFHRKNKIKMNFEFGSQWWCLTYECLKWMKNYIDTHPKYISFFKHSLTPDESFFQTLFMASPFIHTQKRNLTYLKWEGNSPKVFRTSDFDILSERLELFARKFDFDIDKDVVELLMEHKQ